jgi:ATP-dependent DNA ligase
MVRNDPILGIDLGLDLAGDVPDRRLSYYVFDLLHLDGHDLTRLPLVQRKRALQGLLASMPEDGPVYYRNTSSAMGLRRLGMPASLV